MQANSKGIVQFLPYQPSRPLTVGTYDGSTPRSSLLMPLNSAKPTDVAAMVRNFPPIRLLFRSCSAYVAVHSRCVIDASGVSCCDGALGGVP
jgi:hypothetical protein